MAIDLDSVFKKVNVVSSAPQQRQEKGDPRIMTFEANQEYLVHLLPYIPDPSKTIVRQVSYSWKHNNRFVREISPATAGGFCPMMQYFRDYAKNHSPQEVDLLKDALQFRQTWLINAYIVHDPVHPENNGKVKVIKASKQLYERIEEGMNGKLDRKWSTIARREVSVKRMAIDLSNEGVNFKVKVGTTPRNAGQDPLKNYTQSEFTYEGCELNLSEQAQEAIYNSAYDLENFEPIKSLDEINRIFNETFLIPRGAGATATPQGVRNTTPFDEDDDIDYGSVTPGGQSVPSHTSSSAARANDMGKLLGDIDEDDDNEPF